MSDTYTVPVNSLSRAEVTGGRVGHFVITPAATSGGYFTGDSAVDDTNGVQMPAPISLYVTSPDEVYVYNANTVSNGSVRVFHNR